MTTLNLKVFQYILLGYSFKYKILLNLTCYNVKFQNCHHSNDQTYQLKKTEEQELLGNIFFKEIHYHSFEKPKLDKFEVRPNL